MSFSTYNLYVINNSLLNDKFPNTINITFLSIRGGHIGLLLITLYYVSAMHLLNQLLVEIFRTSSERFFQMRFWSSTKYKLFHE
jgi:hypothetical protein